MLLVMMTIEMLSRVRQEMPCLNCRLIEMGEMACYAETCPQCHRAPPGTSSQGEPGDPGPIQNTRNISFSTDRATSTFGRRGQLYLNPVNQGTELPV